MCVPDQLESSGHPYGADLPGSSVSTNFVNYAPPVRYNSNIGYEDCRGGADLGLGPHMDIA